MQKTLNILVADDHWIARCALVQVVQGLADDVEVFEACNFSEAKNTLLSEPTMDLVLLDLVMPGLDPLTGLKALKEVAPAVPVVVVSVNEDRDTVLTALDLGISGFIPKTSSRDQILSSLRLVLSGQIAMPQRIIQNQRFAPIFQTAKKEGVPVTDKSVEEHLTPRQREIFGLLSGGLSNTEIAQKLNLSPNTVRVHVHAIMQRLDLSNRTQAVLHAASRH